MNRDAAIEAGARALLHDETNGLCDLGRVCGLCDCFAHQDGGKMRDHDARMRAAAVIDAAAPHLVGESVGYDFVSLDNLHATAQEAIAERDRFVASVNGRKPRWPVVGFVPVEDQP